MDRDTLIEKLADAEHASWSHWMKYLFSQCANVQGDMVIPKKTVEHWQRQMNTPYEQLTDREKESDREEVRKILPSIDAYFAWNR